jgi:uncharacterized protein (DUF1697 family)
MTRYVALLRGIAPMNPNMRNEKLRGVFEALGFTNVRSVISSGNVVFDSPHTDAAAIETQLEAAWSERLGFTSTTIVRSITELEALIGRDPFAGANHSPKTSLNVTFFKHAPTEHPTFEGQAYTIVDVTDRELCAVIDTTTGKTPDYMAKAEKMYGKEITTRTWLTIQRILKAASAEKTGK